MLKELTKEQQDIALETKNFWLDFLFSCKNEINKEQATEGVNFMYELAGLEKPEIIFCDSPLAAQKIANDLKNSVQESVRSSVLESVQDSVQKSVLDSVIKYFDFADYGNLSDYGWVSFYDFFTKINVLDDDKFNKFKALLLSGVYDMIQFKETCIVVSLPNKILRNTEGKLHSDIESAISFMDGFELFFHNGIEVPKKWILEKESLTKDDFLNEKNAEKKRCLVEIIGYEKLINIIGVVIIDESTEFAKPLNKNVPIRLLKTKEKDEVIDDFIYFLHVHDHSTEREYFICLEKEFNDVVSAKKSTFKNEKIEIRHGDVGLLNLSNPCETPLFES